MRLINAIAAAGRVLWPSGTHFFTEIHSAEYPNRDFEWSECRSEYLQQSSFSRFSIQVIIFHQFDYFGWGVESKWPTDIYGRVGRGGGNEGSVGYADEIGVRAAIVFCFS